MPNSESNKADIKISFSKRQTCLTMQQYQNTTAESIGSATVAFKQLIVYSSMHFLQMLPRIFGNTVGDLFYVISDYINYDVYVHYCKCDSIWRNANYAIGIEGNKVESKFSRSNARVRSLLSNSER